MVFTLSTVEFNGNSIGTYGVSAGCRTLKLDSDCSQISGSTRNIKVDGVELRVSGGDSGKVIFVMSIPKFIPYENALTQGSKSIAKILQSKEIQILETKVKVMYGSGKVFGIH